MAETHVVYPGDMADRIERAADARDMSVSAFYKQAALDSIGDSEADA